MGLETAAAVMAVVAVGSEVAKAGEQVSAADAQAAALETQGKELKIQTQQKTLANYDVMEKVLADQTAHMATTGAAFSSPSYNAIQRNTLNIGAKRLANTELEGDLEEQNLDIEKSNVRSKLYADLFGDVAQTSFSAAGIYSKIPTTSNTG